MYPQMGITKKRMDKFGILYNTLLSITYYNSKFSNCLELFVFYQYIKHCRQNGCILKQNNIKVEVKYQR